MKPNIIFSCNIHSTHLPDKARQRMKPPIKWVGGKTQILATLLDKFPKTIANYREPFLGGGSVLLGLLNCIATGEIVVTGTINVSDVNPTLISMWQNIQTQPEQVFIETIALATEFMALATDGAKETYYYALRTRYNETPLDNKVTPKGTAMFIFLNKTCFRGLYRMGPKGFNVPYGFYKNPEIINREHLYGIHRLIQPVVFTCCGFADAIKCDKVVPDDFIYFDPPYASPLAKTTPQSFVGYTADGFGQQSHTQLFDLINSLPVTTKIMMSNADVDQVRSKFPVEKYATETIQCKRAINSKKPGSTAAEVIITNYVVQQTTL